MMSVVFLEYSYGKASDVNISCPVGGESSKMQGCVSSVKLRDLSRASATSL